MGSYSGSCRRSALVSSIVPVIRYAIWLIVKKANSTEECDSLYESVDHLIKAAKCLGLETDSIDWNSEIVGL